MAEVRQGDMLNWMMDLDRFLLDCNSFTELADHLHTWLTEHNCGSLYLLMNTDIFMLENVSSFLKFLTPSTKALDIQTE